MKHVARWLGTMVLAAVAGGCGEGTARNGGTVGPLAPRLVTATAGAVTISGPSSVRPNIECPFLAIVSGATGPFTYYWSQTAGTGYSDGADGYNATSAKYNYILRVTVEDGSGYPVGSASKSVTVSSSAPMCP